MCKAVGYTRVSTEEQADEGYSLGAQEAKIRAQAIVSDLELVDVIVDPGFSGKDMVRPGLERLLRMVRKREVEAVVIPKLDRLTRRVKDLEELIEMFDKNRVRLISLHEALDTRTAAGRMVIRILASVSQMEREQIGERTKAVLQFKKSRGERTGNVPYGYYADEKGRLRRNAVEQEVVDEIYRLHDLGDSLRGIAEALNKAGLRTRAGTEWKFQYIDRILRGRQV